MDTPIEIDNDGTRGREFHIHDVDCTPAVVPAVMSPQPEMKGVIIGIYKITSPTGAVYIGLASNIIKRWRSYKNSGAPGQWRLDNSIKKHGWDNHKKEVVVICSESDLPILEPIYIKAFESFGTQWGMNLTSGGDNPTFSNEARKRMSESQKGKTPWNKGLTNIYSDEALREMGNGQRGKIGTFSGKKHRKDSCDKMSASQVGNTNGLGIKRGSEVGRKISAKIMGHVAHNKRPVIQMNLNGEFIKEWESIAAAELQFPNKSRNITCCVRGKQKTAYGFKWEYAIKDKQQAA